MKLLTIQLEGETAARKRVAVSRTVSFDERRLPVVLLLVELQLELINRLWIEGSGKPTARECPINWPGCFGACQI